MRLALFAAAASLAIAASAWAGAAPSRATDEHLVKDPDWLAAPSFEERAKAYPKAALVKGAGGETALRCKVKADGGLEACVLASETPTGLGFGPAALALADRFRMKPEAIPRPATDEAEPEVIVQIRWAIVEKPAWASTPSGDQLAALYPDQARARRLPGVTRMRCEVQTDGTLANCFIRFEAPDGAGFGKAALRAARYFRMKPETLDGKPVAGGMVVIPIKWQVGGADSDVLVGDGSMLAVALKPGAKPDQGHGNRVFDCASATDKRRKCLAIPAPWRNQPSNALAWEVMNHHHIEGGMTWLSCRVGDDGALVDCTVSGTASADKEAAMRELAAGLKVKPQTSEGVPTSGQLMLVRFDWDQLRVTARPAPTAGR